MIDAVKSFDIIFAITQGGPARHRRRQSLSLQRRLHLLRTRHGSAIAVMLFLLIVALAALLCTCGNARVDRDRGGA